MEDESVCNTTLDLCLGLGNRETTKSVREICYKNSRVGLDLSFSLGNSKGAIANNLEEFQAGHEGSKERHGKKRVVESVNNEGSTSGAKKLRLTKEQSTILEDCFKVDTNPAPEQKQTLAEQLNIMPRQVEIWFQNRRARTKLKKTEMDYECLKKNCQILIEENTNLKRELQELRSLKMGTAPIFVHHITRVNPANTTTYSPCGMPKTC